MNLDVLKEMGETGSEAVLIYHLPSHRFQYLNHLATLIWERPVQWFFQDPHNLISAIHPEDLPVLKELFGQLQNGTRFVQTEARVLLPETGFKSVKFKVYAFSQGPGEVLLAGFAEDISGQKSHENYLLEFGNKKNSALEILAHDLSGPLHIAKTLANRLEQENLQHTNRQHVEFARIIQQVCEGNLDLIGNVLTDEHLKSPLVKLKKEPVNLVELTRLVLETYKAAENNDQAIEVVSNAAVIMASVDRIKFSQMINNLISNAIKFTPANGSIRFALTDTGAEVQVSITDTGIGIPGNLQPYLFTRHSKASRPGLKGEPSRGIGMYITKTLVEMHNGKIWLESQENAGTTFYILLPKN